MNRQHVRVDPIEALMRSLQSAGARAALTRDDLPPRPGDVYLLPSEGDTLVRVVVCDVMPADRRCRVVAADDLPVVRDGLDERTAPEAAVELTVRTDRVALVSGATLAPDDRVGAVPVGMLATLRAMTHVARSSPGPDVTDEALADTLCAIDEEMRRLRARDARLNGQHITFEALVGQRGRPFGPSPRGADEQALLDDDDTKRQSDAAENNRPTYFVLRINDDDSLSAVAYPLDGVYMEFRGAPDTAPRARAIYRDHEVEGEWVPGGDEHPTTAQTRDPFRWEDDAVELCIGDGYTLRITRPVAWPR